jgi:hypothetical protein
VTGLLFTVLFFPLVGWAVSRLAGRVPLFLAGMGSAGALAFVASVWHLPLRWTLLAIAVGSVVIVATTKRPSPERIRYPALPLVLTTLAAGVLLFAAAVLPLEDYDGRAFWLLKAKAIAHEGSVDGPFFQGETAPNRRNEYPLLVPMDAAVIWIAARSLDDTHIRWLFALVPIALAFGVQRRVAERFDAATGAWCAALLLWLPQVAVENEGGALSGYADLAMGAFAAFAFFELVERASPLRMGMWCSFVALTKNEGLPLAVVLLAVGAVAFRRRVWIALVPFAFAVGHLFVWRARIERREDEDLARSILALPDHLPRFGETLVAMLGNAASLRDWGAFLLACALAFFLVRDRWTRFAAAAVVVPMLALYAAVYAVFDPALWPVGTLSANVAPRLWTHLLGPMTYLYAAASARRPAATADGS